MKPEDRIQLQVREIYGAAGGAWYDLSQGFRPGGDRHGGTRQTPGLGDLFVIFPSPIGVALWHETKAIRPSDLAKKDWLATCFAKTVVRDAKVRLKIAQAILDNIATTYARVVSDIGDDRRRELYRRKQSKEQIDFQERIDQLEGSYYVLGGVLEALAFVRALPDLVRL